MSAAGITPATQRTETVIDLRDGIDLRGSTELRDPLRAPGPPHSPEDLATHPFHRHLTIASWFGLGVLVMLNVADLVTTQIAIHHGALEANPVSRAFLAHGTLHSTKLILLAVLGLLLALSRARLRTVVALWFVAGIYAMIVVSNVLVITQLSR